MRGHYLVTEEAAEFLALSVDTVLRKVAAGQIPSRKIAGVRRVFFVEAELVAWLDGAPLEVVESANGNRIVKPIETGRS